MERRLCTKNDKILRSIDVRQRMGLHIHPKYIQKLEMYCRKKCAEYLKEGLQLKKSNMLQLPLTSTFHQFAQKVTGLIEIALGVGTYGQVRLVSVLVSTCKPLCLSLFFLCMLIILLFLF